MQITTRLARMETLEIFFGAGILKNPATFSVIRLNLSTGRVLNHICFDEFIRRAIRRI